MGAAFGPRRAIVVDGRRARRTRGRSRPPSSPPSRPSTCSTARSAPCCSTTCPRPGTPGGSISSGRFSAALLFDALDYDLGRPRPRRRRHDQLRGRPQGHGPLRHVGAARRDRAHRRARAAAGRPPRSACASRTCSASAATPPRRRRSSAASAPGRSTATRRRRRPSCGSPPAPPASAWPARSGSAIGARDRYGADCPRVHIFEGEGGLTPGRVAEALAAAGTASLANVVLHLDWNQASIDSDRVCREGVVPGDYVQWDPRELFYLHDWNVVPVADGHDFQQVVAAPAPRARRSATASRRRSSTARARAGSTASRAAPRTAPATSSAPRASTSVAGSSSPAAPSPVLPTCEPGDPRCAGPAGDEVREECFWAALQLVRRRLETEPAATASWRGASRGPRAARAGAAAAAPGRAARRRRLRARARASPADTPDELRLAPGRRSRRCARSSAARCASAARPPAAPSSSPSADLARLDQRRTRSPPASRRASGTRAPTPTRACCPSAASARTPSPACSRGISRLRARPRRRLVVRRLHGAARAHRGAPARHRRPGAAGRHRRAVQADVPGLRARRPEDRRGRPHARRPAAAAAPAGELPAGHGDHADALGAAGDLAAARRPRWRSGPRSSRRSSPGRPSRCSTGAALGLAPAEAAVTGVYLLRATRGAADVTVVLQESAVTYAFVTEALPLLDGDGHRRAGLLRRQRRALRPAAADERRASSSPRSSAAEAIGITGFTLPTLVPLGAVRRRAARRRCTRSAGPLPGQRPGRGGARRGRPRRREPGRRRGALRRRGGACRSAARC